MQEIKEEKTIILLFQYENLQRTILQIGESGE